MSYRYADPQQHIDPPPEPSPPVCPVCGEECEWIHIDLFGRLSGCDLCMGRLDAWDAREKGLIE